MKYFIWFCVVLTCLTAGAVGMGYYSNSYSHDFQDMTGLTWDEFANAHKGCVAMYQEPCNLYGGFAPLSKFNDGRDGKPIGKAL